MLLSSLIRIISTHFKFHKNSLKGLYDGLEIWNLIDMNRYLDYRHCILLFGKQSNPGPKLYIILPKNITDVT